MADSREFVLIGEFRDGITPELAKINNQLAQLKQSFSNIGGKGARTAARDLSKFNAAGESLTDTLKTQNQVLRSTIEPMRQYRREVGKTVGALKKLDEAGGRAIGIERTNTALREQIRLMDQLRSRRGLPGIPSGKGAGGGGRGGGGGGGGGRGGKGGAFEGHMGEFGFAFTLGNAISQPITNSIVKGFEIGVGLMTKPFEYVAGAFGERIRDELDDLKAAGGFLSISKRSKNPFVENMDDAIEFQQKMNGTFAKMAAQLPGVTNDYVMVGKRLGDTVARVVESDFDKARAEANRIRATTEGAKFYGAAPITGAGAEDRQQVITTLLGEMTKKTTIAGLGGRTGAGGTTGAYGLPGLAERMISQDEVSMGQFQRYAAVFSDPTISDALQRNVDKVNATAKNSVERYKAMQKLFDEVVTPELIDKLRTSVDGVYQGLRSAILDPDTGLFGLGRQFQGLGKRLNSFGQYVDKFGNVVDNVRHAADVDLSLFEILRDIFSNLGQVLTPIIENLGLLFDPLRKVSEILVDARHYTAELARTFNNYRKGLEDLSKKEGKAFLKETLDFRASLGTLNNLLLQFGAIGQDEFKNTANILMNQKDVDFGKMLQGMIDKLLNSKVAEGIGKMLGQVVGTVLVEVSKVTGLISGRLANSSKLVSGFQTAFEKAGGGPAIARIFEDVFKSMLEVLKMLWAALPIEAKMVGAAALILPALIQGGSMLLAEAIGKAAVGMFTKAAALATGGQLAAGATAAGTTAAGTTAAGTGTALGSLALPAAAVAGFIIFDQAFLSFANWLSQQATKLKDSQNWAAQGFAVLVAGLSALIEGLTNTFKGAFDMIVALFTGDIEKVKQGFVRMMNGIVQVLGGVLISVIGVVATLGTGIVEAVKNIFIAIWEGIMGIKRGADEGYTETKGKGSRWNAQTKQTEVLTADGWQPAVARAKGMPGYRGSLGQAIGHEMKHKPAGSDLVIANSSETVIPAAGGYGMQDFIQILQSGFNAMVATYKETQQKQENTLKNIQGTLVSNQQQTNTRLAKLETKFAAPGMTGGLGGGAAGGVDAFTPIAQRMGLTMTSGYRPGDPGWHGANRARDFSNGTGPTPQMMQFAQYMASTYGSNLKELIYTPLGFSIKNGQRVAPYAQGAHYNHVHVAYAMGAGNPILAPTKELAQKIDSQVFGRANVDTFTTGRGEFGSETNVVNNITISQLPGQDTEALAALVALRIGEAVADARAASIFV